jgi:hypothetical protein
VRQPRVKEARGVVSDHLTRAFRQALTVTGFTVGEDLFGVDQQPLGSVLPRLRPQGLNIYKKGVIIGDRGRLPFRTRTQAFFAL